MEFVTWMPLYDWHGCFVREDDYFVTYFIYVCVIMYQIYDHLQIDSTHFTMEVG